MKTFLVIAAFMAAATVALAEELPVPPMPPDHPPEADAAPVPNLNAQAPVAPESEKPSLNMKMYRASMYSPGVGFTPGSRYQSSEDRKPIATPGFSIDVPLK
jgi:hypothetical protein